MPERSWDELVAQGRKATKALSGAQWELGDLTIEAIAFRHGGDRVAEEAGETTLTEYAEAIGVPFNTLRDYRKVAQRFPKDARASLPWSTHRALAERDDRFELLKRAETEGWTVSRALEAAGRKPVSGSTVTAEDVKRTLLDPDVARRVMADPQVRHMIEEAVPSEDRAEQARRLVRDPAVARHVVRDDTARSAMARAAKDMEKEADQRQRERAPGLVGLSDFYQATGELSRARQALTKSLDAMRKVDLEDDQRESLKEDSSRVRLVLDWIDSYLESGDHSFDKELDALLREEL